MSLLVSNLGKTRQQEPLGEDFICDQNFGRCHIHMYGCAHVLRTYHNKRHIPSRVKEVGSGYDEWVGLLHEYKHWVQTTIDDNATHVHYWMYWSNHDTVITYSGSY